MTFSLPFIISVLNLDILDRIIFSKFPCASVFCFAFRFLIFVDLFQITAELHICVKDCAGEKSSINNMIGHFNNIIHPE